VRTLPYIEETAGGSGRQLVAEPQLLLRGTAQGRLDLAGHLAAHGEIPADVTRGHVDVLEAAAAVDLRGRGGAGFPFARKAQSVRRSKGRTLVVGNGSEGEPASHKDATLMRRAPHLVIDGLELAAATVSAGEARLVVADVAARRSIEDALAERGGRRSGRRRVNIAAEPVEDHFVAGESSAVVQTAAGGRPTPVFTLRRTAEGGVNGRPTLVSNVETLAHLAVLARIGVAAYRGVGTPEECGTTLLTVHRGLGPEVMEVPFGTPLAGVLGRRSACRSVLVGGYHGAWLTPGTGANVCVSRPGLRDVGGALGAGVVVALPDDACPLIEAAPVVNMLAASSANQCGPCVHGLRGIAGRVQALADGTAEPADLELLERWSGFALGRGACAHPDGVVRFVRSLLDAFADEVSVHLQGSCDRRLWNLLPTGDQP
jgi:NADH:ubiquinone oxidoreductase subunit F (NADH-binding)